MGIGDGTDDLDEKSQDFLQITALFAIRIDRLCRSTYSSARYGRPRSLTPASYSTAICGCCSRARMARSRAMRSLKPLIDPLGAGQLQCCRASSSRRRRAARPTPRPCRLRPPAAQLPWTDPITRLLAPHRGQRLRGEVGHCGRWMGRTSQSRCIGLSQQIHQHRAQMLVLGAQGIEPRGALQSLRTLAPAPATGSGDASLQPSAMYERP